MVIIRIKDNNDNIINTTINYECTEQEINLNLCKIFNENDQIQKKIEFINHKLINNINEYKHIICLQQYPNEFKQKSHLKFRKKCNFRKKYDG
jgi:hypothetical protein